MKEQLLNYIQEHLVEHGNVAIAADDQLLTSGLLDSMAIIRLIGFIEQEFNKSIPPEDMIIENFASVTAIVDYLNQ